ncbi:MAG: anion permease [Anaerolineae bacterium]|nr:anion permease [Anaerolineae bacterium]
MTPSIALTLVILFLATILFITERLRMDVIALLVLGSLALTGLVTPAEALSGFSSPAVVTVWAMFIISGGLSQTGIANLVGRQIMRLAGANEVRLLVVIMLTAALLSAVMNNVGVAAMLLPVVMDITRRINRPPSKLLMPLTLGALLGGLTTLIGTPPNILVSDALYEYGLTPFGLFDFTPTGVLILGVGILYVVFVGRRLLPARNPAQESAQANQNDLGGVYELLDRTFVIRFPANSPLVGMTLADSRLGSALRLNVVAILRHGRTHLAPRPDTVLQTGDRLIVQGRADHLAELHGRQQLTLQTIDPALQEAIAQEIGQAEARLPPRSSLIGQTLFQSDLRARFGVNVKAIWRQGVLHRANLQDTVLQADDVLLFQGPRTRLDAIQDATYFDNFRLLSDTQLAETYQLPEQLIALQIPADSTLAGQTLAESRLGDAFSLTVLGIVREGETHLTPEPEETLLANDLLLIRGKPDDLLTLRGLQEVEIESESNHLLPDLSALESEQIGLAEMVLSPYTTLRGQSLRQLNFREKYGLTVLAIWREGHPLDANLRDVPLQFGDGILLYGPREKLRLLGSEPDFLVLTQSAQAPLRQEKAPVALLIMVVMLTPVLLGWLPIAIAAVIGATLMVLSRCLTMEEAYRFIEWPAVFLIAGMLPLGIAMEQTGAASFLANGFITVIGGLGPRVVIAGLFVLTSLATQIIPTAALVVLMAPIAFNTASDLNLSPYPLMMTVAIAASASFASPVSHPANVMIMGPGGYRFSDYLKVGIPLTLLVLVVAVLFVPVFWPF